jgi:hypothetical protein
VLNKVYIDLKALASYLDPALGHNREPPRNVKSGEKIRAKNEEGPNRSISLTSILSPHKSNSTF